MRGDEHVCYPDYGDRGRPLRCTPLQQQCHPASRTFANDVDETRDQQPSTLKRQFYHVRYPEVTSAANNIDMDFPMLCSEETNNWFVRYTTASTTYPTLTYLLPSRTLNTDTLIRSLLSQVFTCKANACSVAAKHEPSQHLQLQSFIRYRNRKSYIWPQERG